MNEGIQNDERDFSRVSQEIQSGMTITVKQADISKTQDSDQTILAALITGIMTGTGVTTGQLNFLIGCKLGLSV